MLLGEPELNTEMNMETIISFWSKEKHYFFICTGDKSHFDGVYIHLVPEKNTESIQMDLLDLIFSKNCKKKLKTVSAQQINEKISQGISIRFISSGFAH